MIITRGFGQQYIPTYSGLINTPGGGVAAVNLSAADLEGALAIIWRRPLAPGECDVPGVPGAMCTGYLQNVVQEIQAGGLVYDPTTRQWSYDTSRTAPSAAAATAAAAAAARSPFMPGATNVSPVYTQPQSPNVADVARAAGIDPATIVQPTPATQPASSGSSATSGASAVSHANGAAAPPGDTVNAGPVGEIISGVPNIALLAAAGAAVFLMFAMSGR